MEYIDRTWNYSVNVLALQNLPRILPMWNTQRHCRDTHGINGQWEIRWIYHIPGSVSCQTCTWSVGIYNNLAHINMPLSKWKMCAAVRVWHITLRKKRNVESLHGENSSLGFIEAVHQWQWKMPHHLRLLAHELNSIFKFKQHTIYDLWRPEKV